MRIAGYTPLTTYFHRPTGVGKHIDQMFHGLAEASDVQFSVLTTADQLAELSPAHPLADLPIKTIPITRRRAELSWLLLRRPCVDVSSAAGDELDWLYLPMEMPVATRRARRAITVHSLYAFDPQLPEYSRMRPSFSWLKTTAIQRAAILRGDLLLTVSAFVKQQLIDWFGVPGNRIAVVGNGVEPEFYAAGLGPAAPADRPYVVCVSGLNSLDGADYVLATARALLAKDPNIEIRIAGHQHEAPFLDQAKACPNIKLLGYQHKQDLARVFRSSTALLFLNRYESFGIAIVEAMAAATPVIGTNLTAVPEIMGDAGIVADVNDPSAIAEQIIRLARNDSDRQTLISRGLARATHFTWSACVNRLLTALQSHA